MTESTDAAVAQAVAKRAKKLPAKKLPAKKPAAKKPAAKKAVGKKQPATAKRPASRPAKRVPAAEPKPPAKPQPPSTPTPGPARDVLATRPPLAVMPTAVVVAKDAKPAGSLDDFTTHVLGSPPELTSIQVAEQAGVSEDVTRALWRAMGFADVGGATAFTKADVAALKSLMSLVEGGYISFDEAIEMVRAIGQHTSRLAEWQGNIIARSLIERGVMAQHGVLEADDIGALLRDSKAYQPVLEELMVYSWRRQMTSNAIRASAIADAGPEARTDVMTVGFADLAGFTRLSRQIPEEDLANLVQQFESVSADVVATHGSRLIKTLGDEVLFVDAKPKKVAKIALELHEAHHENSNVPRMRIGLATGSVVLRMGDVFGTTVNRASRLTAMAKPGSTFVDAATFEELEDDGRLLFKAVRPRPARGFGLLRAWSLARSKSG